MKCRKSHSKPYYFKSFSHHFHMLYGLPRFMGQVILSSQRMPSHHTTVTQWCTWDLPPWLPWSHGSMHNGLLPECYSSIIVMGGMAFLLSFSPPSYEFLVSNDASRPWLLLARISFLLLLMRTLTLKQYFTESVIIFPDLFDQRI